MRDWNNVQEIVMDAGGEYPQVLLLLLVKRLEEYPDAFQSIPDAVRDMAVWFDEHADQLQRDGGANVLPFSMPKAGSE